MKRIKQFIRLFHINFVLIRNGLDKVVLSIPLFAPLGFLAYLNPWNWFVDRHKSDGDRIRSALEELGPIFVKFGQMLSTRADLLPEDIIFELAKLRDQVPPFDSKVAQQIIIKELGKDLDELFLEFDEKALASASIAQVHAAKLHDGKEVVVKVLRPNIEKTIRNDLSLLYLFASIAQKYWSEAKRLHPVEVVKEFERNIIAELDLTREAANASHLRRNFYQSDLLYIPEVFWDYTRTRVMVMERIYGIPISDIETLHQYGVDLKELAERGVEIFFTQVFRDCFFHADMHPGNIFVDSINPSEPKYIAVDFGIIGTLSKRDQRYLAENFVAFFKRDYRRVAELHIESGWVPADTHMLEFESALRAVCEPIFEKPLREISFGRTLLRLFQTGRQFQMEVQPQLVLLQKTLLSIEGLGRALYPDLDLWQTAKPYMESWMRKQLSPMTMLREISVRFPDWADKLPELPNLIYDSLQATKFSHQKNHGIKSEELARIAQKRRGQGIFQGFGLALLTIAIITSFVTTDIILEQKELLIMTAIFGGTGILALLISAIIPSR